MELLGISRCKKVKVIKINKYNHECRMHGFKVGVVLEVVWYYHDSIVVIVNFRETVTIPKKIAKYITVEMIGEWK